MAHIADLQANVHVGLNNFIARETSPHSPQEGNVSISTETIGRVERSADPCSARERKPPTKGTVYLAIEPIIDQWTKRKISLPTKPDGNHRTFTEISKSGP